MMTLEEKKRLVAGTAAAAFPDLPSAPDPEMARGQRDRQDAAAWKAVTAVAVLYEDRETDAVTAAEFCADLEALGLLPYESGERRETKMQPVVNYSRPGGA